MISNFIGNSMLSGLHTGYVVSLLPSWTRFLRAAKNPEASQHKILKSILSNNRDTVYGKQHNFSSIDSAADFQSKVPIVDYDQLEPWILKAAEGTPNILTAEAVKLFELSGGSSSINKLIPYTSGLLSEFSSATNAWIYNIYASRPKLLGTQAYWSISPISRTQHSTAGGIPIGIQDDTEYFGPIGRWALKQLMIAPPTLAQNNEIDKWRKATLHHLLASKNLGLISVWHPSFLTLLLDFLEQNREEVLSSLNPQRRQELATAFSHSGAFLPSRAWPKLNLVSCWTDASANNFLPKLQTWFNDVEIQGKGLLATEGVVTIPTEKFSAGCATALSSHFLEFIDLQHPNKAPIFAHDLQIGGRYSPILTTSGGLYRYHLKDEVECVRMWHRSPCLRFIGKLDSTSDLRGEKITPAQIDSAISMAQTALGIKLLFAMAGTSQGNPPCYTLYVDAEINSQQTSNLAAFVEARLCESHHYRYCRDLGQLSALQVTVVQNAAQRWQNALKQRGFRVGSLKPLSLDTRLNWDEVFCEANL